MNDPQYTVGAILRPQDNFTALYEGEAVTTPIYLFPGGQSRDELARSGQAGYDPDLIRGQKVSLGATLQLWLPMLSFPALGDPETTVAYKWAAMWRLRNLTDFKLERTPYHVAAEQGPADTSGAVAQPRVIIPAAYETLVFNRQEDVTSPLVDGQRQVAVAHASDYKASSATLPGPILDAAGTEGAVQQGIQDPGIVAAANRPGFMIYELKAKGDELILALYRDAGGRGTWQFQTTDIEVANVLDIDRHVGVYVLGGTDTGMRGVRSSDNA